MNTASRRRVAWLAALWSAAAGAPAHPQEPPAPPVRLVFTEPHMGTQFRIVLFAPDEAAGRGAARAAFARVAELNGSLSDYDASSELMKLCARAGTGPVPAGADLFAVLERSRRFYELSEGAFDVTAGPMTRLWRRTRRTQVLPTDSELAEAKRLVGFDKVRLDAKARTVDLTVPGMQLDLGGIAKGYAADEALRVLRSRGITRALVAAGGDIAVGDPPPGAAGWRIGVAPLEGRGQAPGRFLLLRNAAVSTSGDSEQHLEIDGVRYSHIVDPRTGLGLVGRASVTVVAPDALTSDALAKVVMMRPDRGLTHIEATPGTAALVVRRSDRGDEATASKRWREFEAEKARE